MKIYKKQSYPFSDTTVIYRFCFVLTITEDPMRGIKRENAKIAPKIASLHSKVIICILYEFSARFHHNNLFLLW